MIETLLIAVLLLEAGNLGLSVLLLRWYRRYWTVLRRWHLTEEASEKTDPVVDWRERR